MTSRSWHTTWIRYHSREQGRQELPAMQCGVPTCRMPNARQGSNAGVVGSRTAITYGIGGLGWLKSEHFQLAVQGCALLLVISGDEQSVSRRQSQGASARECDGVSTAIRIRIRPARVKICTLAKNEDRTGNKLGGGDEEVGQLQVSMHHRFHDPGRREQGKGRDVLGLDCWIVSLKLQTLTVIFMVGD